MDARKPILKARNRLPHWSQGEVFQFVTWSLGDALPSEKRRQIVVERRDWVRAHPKPWTPKEEMEYGELFSERVEGWLDRGGGACVLKRPEASECVARTLEYFDGERYALKAYVVMPNHVHVLVSPFAEWSLDRLVHSWKRFSTGRIRKVVGGEGRLWMPGYWDRMIRSVEHLEYVREYIRLNPMRAGLGFGEFVLWMEEEGVV